MALKLQKPSNYKDSVRTKKTLMPKVVLEPKTTVIMKKKKIQEHVVDRKFSANNNE